MKPVHNCLLPKDHDYMIATECMFLINLRDLLMLKLENNEANFPVHEYVMVCELFVLMVLKLYKIHFLASCIHVKK